MSTLLKQVAEPHPDDIIVYIYALCDPRNTAIRYIGKSIKPKQRYKSHLIPSNLKKNNHKNNWIKELLSLNLKPELDILEAVYSSEECTWEEREKKWIALFRSIGGPKLTNHTDGGEGASGLVFSEETRKRIAEANRGRTHSPESIEKIRAAHKGKKKTPQHCLNMSIAQKKKAENLSTEEKKKIRSRPARGASKYRGVSKTSAGFWQATCVVDGRYEYIGAFATEEEAARMRDIFVIQNFGDDWPLNFPIENYSGSDILNAKPRTIGKFSTNQSGFRGVSWRAKESKWNCFVSDKNTSIGLGVFPGSVEGKIAAARTFDIWVIKNRGPKAYTNFPRAEYSSQEIENAHANIPRRADNKSGFRGVSWVQAVRRWKCVFAYKGKTHIIKFQGTEQGKIDAAHAYDRLAIQHKGRLARTNFPHHHYPDLFPTAS